MSRWGGFRKGRKRYKNSWAELKSASADRVESVADTPQEFAYTEAQGIWNLRSTVQFSKSNEYVPPPPAYTTGFKENRAVDTFPKGSYQTFSYDASLYEGATVRGVWKFVNPLSSFRQDLQMDEITIGGVTYSFESGSDGFETSTSNISAYSSVDWSTVLTSANGGRWVRLSGKTGSSSTGDLGATDGSYYLYAETSSPGRTAGYTFWLRSPEVVLTPGNTTISYKAGLSTTDSTDVTLYFSLDVIS